MPFDILFPFKWQDVADILVISLIVHRLFLLFRGTAAFQIMAGFLILWLFQSVAQAAGLVLTSWFFQGVGAVAVLVIVVVFRNEIREILVQTNPVRFFLGRPRKTRTISITLMVQAAFQLAKIRTGALIVFESRDRLGGYLREGFTLDGKFTPQIVESIFARQSPVHDGAIIIRENRINMVGTFLPLTQKEGLPQHFGTRHRAAIGLSDVSDAVVLVVSEERGEVSVVHRGKVLLMLEPQELKKELGRLLLGVTPQAKPRKRPRDWLAQAGGLLLTFFLVSTFWGIYAGRHLSLINVTTPIDFRNIPENLELKKTSAEKVEVQITGKRRLVSALKTEQVGAFLDLKEMSRGVHKVVLNPDKISLPVGLDVVRITPSEIKLEMEKRIEVKKVIKPNIIGSAPAGYRITKINVNPEYVRVSGAVSILRSISSISTEPIDIGEFEPQSGEKTIKVALALSPASLRLLAGQGKEVQVGIQFQPKKPRTKSLHKAKVRYHVVRTGETLWGIGLRYGLTVEELRRLNKLASGVFIYPDQKLRLGTRKKPFSDS